MQFVYDRGLADPGVAGYQHDLRCAARNDSVEGFEQCFALPIAPIELLGDQQPVRCVVCAERKRVNASEGFPIL